MKSTWHSPDISVYTEPLNFTNLPLGICAVYLLDSTCLYIIHRLLWIVATSDDRKAQREV